MSLNLRPLWTTLSTRLSNSRCNEVGKKHGLIYVLLLFNSLVCKRTPNCGEEEGGKPLFCLCSSSNVSSHPFFSIATLFYTCTYFSWAIGISFNFAFIVATPVKWAFFVAAASAFTYCLLVLWVGRALSVTPRVSSPTTAGTGLASVFSHSVGFLRRRGSARLFRDNAWSLLGSEELPAAELVRTQPTTLLCSNTDSPRDPETAIIYAKLQRTAFSVVNKRRLALGPPSWPFGCSLVGQHAEQWTLNMAVDCPLLITSILLAKSGRSIYRGGVFLAVSWPKSLLVHVWGKTTIESKKWEWVSESMDGYALDC